MGIRENMRAFFMNAPRDVLESLKLPNLEISSALRGKFGYLHFFTVTQAEMDEVFPKLQHHLEPTGMLWISWLKNRKLETDLTLPKIIEIGYSHGLVESTCLSVDATWSGIKFTHPKKGKTYNNSFGKLPTR